MLKEIDQKLDYVEWSPEKDSLKSVIINYVETNINSLKDLENTKVKLIVEEGKKIISDSVVTTDELNRIKKMIEGR
jgi:hypothetical protein